MSMCMADAYAAPQWVCRFGGMERWNGMVEWTGLEWNGMEWNGMEWHNQRGPWPTEVSWFRYSHTPFFFFFFFPFFLFFFKKATAS